jgi:homoserine kinase
MSSKKNVAAAFAPASVGNVGVGFDVLGLAVNNIGDKVRIKKIREKKIVINSISGINGITDKEISAIPLLAEKNTATVGLLEMMHDFKLNFGFQLDIFKGIPLGSGLGGSAASSVAAVMAANQLLNKPLNKEALYKYTLSGEAAATGSRHGDNVGPSLLGGLVITPKNSERVMPVPYSKKLRIVLVYPGFRLDTQTARAVLPDKISMSEHVLASGKLAQFLVSCNSKKLDGIKDFFSDDLIEPKRAHLIKGFLHVKAAALNNGALGCSISGAGPTVFALCVVGQEKKILSAMTKAFIKAGHKNTKGWVSAINSVGAKIIK